MTMDSTLLLGLCIAGAVAAVVFFVSRIVVGEKDTKIINRLQEKQPVDSKAASVSKDANKGNFVPLLQRIGQAASQPFMPKTREKQSTLRKKLSMAGIYSPSAIKVVTGAKVILLGMGLLLGYGLGFWLNNMM